MRFFRKQGDTGRHVEDQRSYERIRMVLNVLCRQRGSDFPIFTDDVSEAGLRFICQQPLRADDDALLLMPLRPGQPPFPLKGRVVWVKQEGEHQYVGGISFMELDGDARAAWTDFIARNRR